MDSLIALEEVRSGPLNVLPREMNPAFSGIAEAGGTPEFFHEQTGLFPQNVNYAKI
jgi:hypothetical protein